MDTLCSVELESRDRFFNQDAGEVDFGDDLLSSNDKERGVELYGLMKAIAGSRLIGYRDKVSLSDIYLDHHEVTPNSLFAAVKGSKSDGHDFIDDAIDRGASSILLSEERDLRVPQLVVPEASIRQEVARAASIVYGAPSNEIKVIGVTGTNGKTTVVHVLSQVLETLDQPCGELGTLWGRLTTPEAPELQRQLRDFVTHGKRYAAIEVSSIALDRHRTDFVNFETAIFTNLSQDHLDVHGSMENYFQAKLKLFRDRATTKRAVVFSSDPYGQRVLREADVPLRAVGMEDVEGYRLSGDGTEFTYRGRKFRSPLVGVHNLANLLLVVATLEGLGFALDEISEALEDAGEPKGRLEFIDEGQDFDLVVDYAHTPAAMKAVLEALSLRLSTGARLITVFGCGGDRDRYKRPEMGRVASTLSAHVVITNDNPRSEDPKDIAREIASGVVPGSHVETVLDRKDAIQRAVSVARSGDVVLVAGKGHERRQIIKDQEIAFDDTEVAREVLRSYLGVKE